MSNGVFLLTLWFGQLKLSFSAQCKPWHFRCQGPFRGPRGPSSDILEGSEYTRAAWYDNCLLRCQHILKTLMLARYTSRNETATVWALWFKKIEFILRATKWGDIYIKTLSFTLLLVCFVYMWPSFTSAIEIKRSAQRQIVGGRDIFGLQF